MPELIDILGIDKAAPLEGTAEMGRHLLAIVKPMTPDYIARCKAAAIETLNSDNEQDSLDMAFTVLCLIAAIEQRDNGEGAAAAVVAELRAKDSK